ncbi:hypothetical protein VTJ49DRAFT_2770 [Mycothermus thermophilus]|uniref:Calponin-homology (CH) domain-containing protein n=1 Tax=Humicola insolens TaxID=85995 RepID=A0ABR3VA96_HUMIN
MASVTSLDKDLRKLRLDKYTPAAANEARQWIEEVLGERLPPGDLLDALKDGVALCKLVNLAVGPPGVKFKKSPMPFVQMENISHFLRACQGSPLNLQQHDMFLTVDLYEHKDPAQVLQCLGAFSRAANAVNPAAFPNVIGPRSGKAVVSPQSTGQTSPVALRGRGVSNASSNASSLTGRPALRPAKTGESASGRWSPTKSPPPTASSPPPVSSWSKREQEVATAPAWNIAQYGYMGGASQGNLGIAFGGRRQITSAGPYVPNAAEKEKRRREQEAEAERQRQEEERRRKEQEEEEERARLEEERRWEEEARRLREEERRRLEEEKRRWEEEERQWKLTEERRRREEEEAEARLQAERERLRARTPKNSTPQLRGQYLSQYRAEEESAITDKERIRQLEKELELARQREAEYERERQARSLRPGAAGDAKKARSRSRPRAAQGSEQTVSRQDSWSVRDERNFTAAPYGHHRHQQELDQHDEEELPLVSPRPLPDPTALAPSPMVKTHRTGEPREAPPLPLRTQHTGSRPLPDPTEVHSTQALRKQHTGGRPLPDPAEVAAQPIRNQHTGSRPLPNPAAYASPRPQQQQQQRPTSPFPAPIASPQPPAFNEQQDIRPKQTFARELMVDEPTPAPRATSPDPNSTSTPRRTAPLFSKKSPPTRSPTTFYPRAGKSSLLEREMELERQRQREWEESQREMAARRAENGESQDQGVDGIGGGIGGRWDVSQWAGYTGGDSQNKGAQGIGTGMGAAGRRQIVGPRPLPNPPR